MFTGSVVWSTGIVCPAFNVLEELPFSSSRYFSPIAETDCTIAFVSAGSGSTFFSSLRLAIAAHAAGALVLVDRQRADDAHARAGDAHLVGGLQAGALGQFDFDVVGRHERQAVVGVVGEEHGDEHDQRRHGPDQQRASGERVSAAAVHQGVSEGSQLSSSPSTNGEEPSAAGCVAAPGQRRSWPDLRFSSAACGLVGVSFSFSPSFEVGQHRADARVVPVGVVVGARLAEGAQRACEVGRVGAEEGRDRNRFARGLHDARRARSRAPARAPAARG